MKKIITVCMIFAVCLCMYACTKNNKTGAGQNNVPSTEFEHYSVLSDETYDGYTYRILVRKGHMNSQYFDEAQPNVVDDAVYRRNKAVEAKFNINIVCSESADSNTDISALNSILAGDDAYDIIFTHSRSAFVYASQGACYNIHDIKTIHTDMPWWSRDVVESCTIGGNLYVLDGDMSIQGLGNTMCLFFNKRIFNELGLEYPYEKVMSGQWTFDEFAELVKKGSKDLNGDGVFDPEADRYGFTTTVWSAPINILYAGGEKVYSKDEKGNLQLSLYSNKTVDIFDSFFDLMSGNECYLQTIDSSGQYINEDIFRQGRSMFDANSLGAASRFRDMTDDFGILPYPKFHEDDEYHTSINAYSSLAVIPVTVSDVERTGAITEALAAYGKEYVVPAFYDVTLKNKYSRDEESEEMMDIIKDSIIYDIGYLSGGVYQSHGHDLAVDETKNFSSWYFARESQAEIALKNFCEGYGGQNE